MQRIGFKGSGVLTIPQLSENAQLKAVSYQRSAIRRNDSKRNPYLLHKRDMNLSIFNQSWPLNADC
jgi:hypothetical protein